MADLTRENRQPEQEEHEFKLLMLRVKQGSQEAARELFERYGPHIRRVVRRKLHQKLRSQFDSQDFVQDVWASFFGDQKQLADFERPEALIGFLANMAYNKVVDAFRHNIATQKRDVYRDRPLEKMIDMEGVRLAADDPTPSQVVAGNEEWDQLLKRLPARYRAILTLLRQGDTHEQIALKLGLNVKTVQRLLRKIVPESGQ